MLLPPHPSGAGRREVEQSSQACLQGPHQEPTVAKAWILRAPCSKGPDMPPGADPPFLSSSFPKNLGV